MESIICPGCQRPIRVPPEAIGQRAQCPFCKCHFIAPPRDADGQLPPPRLLRQNPFAQRRVFPATLLLFASILGILQNSLQAAQAYWDPKGFEERTLEQFEKSEQFKEMGPATVKWRPRIQVASAALSIVSLLGAIAMLRARSHSLAMVGSVVGMFNVANCCCFANILIGGWSLSVLMNPDVRAEFRGGVRHNEPSLPAETTGG